MSAKRTRIASSSSSSDGDNNSFMFNQVLPPAPTTDFWCNPGMVPVNAIYAMPVPVAPMMFLPCMAPASGGAPLKMESSQPQLGSFLERCHLCKKWIGDNDVYMYGYVLHPIFPFLYPRLVTEKIMETKENKVLFGFIYLLR